MLKPTHSPHYSAPTLHAPHPLPTPKFSPHNFLTNPQLTISIYLYAYLRHACPIHHTAADRRCRSSVSGYPHTCTFGTFSTHYHYHYPHTHHKPTQQRPSLHRPNQQRITAINQSTHPYHVVASDSEAAHTSKSHQLPTIASAARLLTPTQTTRAPEGLVYS